MNTITQIKMKKEKEKKKRKGNDNIILYHIIYNKSWAQTSQLRYVASPNCRNFIKFLDF